MQHAFLHAYILVFKTKSHVFYTHILGNRDRARESLREAEGLGEIEFVHALLDELDTLPIIEEESEKLSAIKKWHYTQEARTLQPLLEMLGEVGREESVTTAGAAWLAMRSELISKMPQLSTFLLRIYILSLYQLFLPSFSPAMPT